MNNADTMTIAKREDELSIYYDKQPYRIEQDGIKLEIAKNVFPSDFGLTSSFVGQFVLQQQPALSALDMACGSGYFAFLLKKIGCQHVVGVDLNADAIACAQQNRLLNPELAPIEFIRSDVFADVPKQRFELIMFNFNYYPSSGLYGLNADGGQEILRRFFKQVAEFSQPDTRIWIPFSIFVGAEHDPKLICQEFGYAAKIVASLTNAQGEHCIYEIRRG